MNRIACWSVLALSFAAFGFSTGCGSSSAPPPPPAEVIAATSGGGQNTTVGTAFASSLVATVTKGGPPASGVGVTFTAPASGASGIFASNSTATETVMTNSSGVATSSSFTANTTAGTVTVTASATGASAAASFSLTNKPGVVASSYCFDMSGNELINTVPGGVNFYALAGALKIDSFGNVVGGEQDYNDAIGLTSPQNAGDTITGGKLTVSATTGQGTLTLTTNNAKLGIAGTETFAVQFANTKHALIAQFDGTATSSGGMDLQTLPSTLSGGYAFTMSGVSGLYLPIGFGGVFSIAGTTLSNGILDVNDAQNVNTGEAFTATTISAADSFGRGTIGGFSIDGVPIALNYYIVDPEVIRIIDVNTTDSSVGSAFSQGASAFSNASLGKSVFGMAGNPWGSGIGAAGQVSTSNTSSSPADLSGVGDDWEPLHNSATAPAFPISGTYSIGPNGYGSMKFNSLGLGSFHSVGIYMTDPTLNLNDPNNPVGGGGALALDLDSNLSGTSGVLLPQTDTTTAHFAGNYAVGAQDFNNFNSTCKLCEFDMVGQGSVTGGALSLSGLVSDPFATVSAGATSSGDTFSGTPLADALNPGRYSMFSTNTPPNTLAATVDGAAVNLEVVLYQASGEQLLWLNVNNLTPSFTVFLGPVEQQGSLAGLPVARKVAKIRTTK